MIPLVDMHCHLLAGFDDGPATDEDVLAMCRTAYDEGTRMIAALAHQNDQWPDVTPERIRAGVRRLAQQLREAKIGLKLFPCAEIMACPDLEARWRRGDFLSYADRRQHVLVEQPHGLFVDLRDAVSRLRQSGVRVIIAHPERSPELLHDEGAIEELIKAGGIVQVNSQSITKPASAQDERAIKSWFKRGVAHVLGSDGHSPHRRPPKMAQAYEQIVRWVGSATADRVASTNPMAILQGLPLRIPEPQRPTRQWFSALWPSLR